MPAHQTLVSLVLFSAAATVAANFCTSNTTFSEVAPATNLTGFRVLITGGDGGLGYPISLELATRGASVIIASHNLTKCSRVAREISARTGGEVRAMELDLSSLRSVRRLTAQLTSKGQALHLLVNNAGIAGNPQHLSDDGYQLLFQVNYLGPFLLTHLLLPSLRAARGRVVNVASSEQAIVCQATFLGCNPEHTRVTAEETWCLRGA